MNANNSDNNSIIPSDVIPGLKDNIKIQEGNVIMKEEEGSSKNIANIQNPVNILKQQSSKITTNPFIPNEQKIKEFEIIDKEANEIIKKAYSKNDIYNFSINEINKRISKSITGFLDDLFVKPEKYNWVEYLQLILLEEERYVYFGFILIMFVIFMKFIE